MQGQSQLEEGDPCGYINLLQLRIQITNDLLAPHSFPRPI